MLKPYIVDDPEIQNIIHIANQVDSGRVCLNCHKFKAALYHVGNNQVTTGCPYCLSLNLAKLITRRDDLPKEIITLLDEAKEEVIVQNYEKLSGLGVFPKKTFNCFNCNQEIPRNNVCFLFSKSSVSSNLYCKECHKKLAVGIDKLILDGLTPVRIDFEAGKAYIDK
jgi:hypothetical protein